MNLFLLILLLWTNNPFLMAQQSAQNVTDSKGKKQGVWIKKRADGKLVYEGSFFNDLPVGKWKRYHPNGKLMAELDYGGMAGDTCRTTLFDEEGLLMARGAYYQQKKEGVWSTYNERGQLSGKQFYKQGLQEGIGEAFGAGGKLLEQTEWENGRLNGVSKVYDPNGQLVYEITYKDDRLDGPVVYYHPSGKIRLQGTYAEGKRIGTWKSFSQAGVPTGTTVYNNGVAADNDAQIERESRYLDLLIKQKGRFDEPEADF